MSEIELFAIYILDRECRYHLDTQFGGEIIEDPDVMVAYIPIYFNSAVGEFGKFTEESDESTRHDISILIPIIEYIAYEIDGVGVVADRIKETHHL